MNRKAANPIKKLDNLNLRALREILTLWQHADPGIAEVEDARERLAGLKSQ